MPFTQPSYRVFWSVNQWLVEVDPATGETPFPLNRVSALKALNHVRYSRADYRSRAAWENAINLFQGALEALQRESEKQLWHKYQPGAAGPFGDGC